MLVYQESKSAIITVVSELKMLPILEFDKLVLCKEDSFQTNEGKHGCTKTTAHEIRTAVRHKSSK
jgi:hypothetical protein